MLNKMVWQFPPGIDTGISAGDHFEQAAGSAIQVKRRVGTDAVGNGD